MFTPTYAMVPLIVDPVWDRGSGGYLDQVIIESDNGDGLIYEYITYRSVSDEGLSVDIRLSARRFETTDNVAASIVTRRCHPYQLNEMNCQRH